MQRAASPPGLPAGRPRPAAAASGGEGGGVCEVTQVAEVISRPAGCGAGRGAGRRARSGAGSGAGDEAAAAEQLGAGLRTRGPSLCAQVRGGARSPGPPRGEPPPPLRRRSVRRSVRPSVPQRVVCVSSSSPSSFPPRPPRRRGLRGGAAPWRRLYCLQLHPGPGGGWGVRSGGAGPDGRERNRTARHGTPAAGAALAGEQSGRLLRRRAAGLDPPAEAAGGCLRFPGVSRHGGYAAALPGGGEPASPRLASVTEVVSGESG